MGTINIVTIQGNWNYGNRLQNYAVAEVYRSFGLTPKSLILRDGDAIFNALKLKIKRFVFPIIKKQFSEPELMMTNERTLAFRRFSKRIDFRIVHSLSEIASSDDWFSVGSDQVWSTCYLPEMDEWYFLEGVRADKKIALAPSIGLDSLDKEQAYRLAKAVEGYVYLSVREKRGAEIIRDVTGLDAKVICDPTLVLSAEEWRAVADGRCTPAEPYVLTYLLGGVGAEASDVLDKVTDHGRIPVVPLSDRQKPGEPDAGPAEFIDLIDHASHVVTDSFHAAVFSSILHTPLTIVHREGGASMFSRLEQLSQTLGIEEKVYGSPSYDLARAGEYEGVDEAIGRERERFMDFLVGCLNG